MTSNLPERQTVALDGLGGQAALFEDPQQVMALSASELRMVGVEIAQAVRPRLAEMRRYVGLVAWAMRAKVPAGEYGKWAEGYAEMVGISIRTLGEWRSKVEAVNPYQSPRKTAGQSTQLAETAETSKPIPAASTEAPAKSPEGLDQAGLHRAGQRADEPSGAVSANDPPTPSGPSSGGARTTAPPRLAPTGEAPTSSGPAPLDPTDDVPGSPDPAFQRPTNPPELMDAPVDVDAIGLRWLQSKNDRQVRALADPLGSAIRAEVKRWASAFGYLPAAPPAPAEKPQRRQGTITRPQAAVIAGRAIETNGSAVGSRHAAAVRSGKRHADDCSCLSCKAPKAVAK